MWPRVIILQSLDDLMWHWLRGRKWTNESKLAETSFCHLGQTLCHEKRKKNGKVKCCTALSTFLRAKFKRLTLPHPAGTLRCRRTLERWSNAIGDAHNYVKSTNLTSLHPQPAAVFVTPPCVDRRKAEKHLNMFFFHSICKKIEEKIKLSKNEGPLLVVTKRERKKKSSILLRVENQSSHSQMDPHQPVRMNPANNQGTWEGRREVLKMEGWEERGWEREKKKTMTQFGFKCVRDWGIKAPTEKVRVWEREKEEVRVILLLLLTWRDYNGLMAALFHGILNSNAAQRRKDAAGGGRE